MNHLVTPSPINIGIEDDDDNDDHHIGRSLPPDDEGDSRSQAFQNAPVPSKITVLTRTCRN
jgi:hypothetical protein